MMPRKRMGGLVAAFAGLAVLAASAFATDLDTATLHTATGAHEIEVEVADTPDTRATGLMNRESMPQDHGMLFVFDESRAITMWMKNTLIPLDMLFLNEEGVITHVKTNARPLSLETISSNGPARFVLELNGGAASQLGVSRGDRLEHERIPAS